jgi:hypothetical protein
MQTEDNAETDSNAMEHDLEIGACALRPGPRQLGYFTEAESRECAGCATYVGYARFASGLGFR